MVRHISLSLSLYIYMYIHICIFVCVYMRVYMYMHTYLYVCVFMYVYISIPRYAHLGGASRGISQDFLTNCLGFTQIAQTSEIQKPTKQKCTQQTISRRRESKNSKMYTIMKTYKKSSVLNEAQLPWTSFWGLAFLVFLIFGTSFEKV